MAKPLIGITLDAGTPGPPKLYSLFPWYGLRQHYADCVIRHGGTPILLPHNLEMLSEYTKMLDGLMLTGGDFDIDPTLYGHSEKHIKTSLKPDRTSFELQMTQHALEASMPILGICAGMQLLTVILGGTLIQHIPDVIPNPLPHEQPNSRDQAGHMISVQSGTLLHRLCQKTHLPVNSAHHQAVRHVAEGMIVNAVASDGIIEGVEWPQHPFCLGVQWHPEIRISAADDQIIQGFIQASKRL